MEVKGRYTHGDSDLAAERLDLVAGMFEPPTRGLLERAVAQRPVLAVDLGCGPGHTTRLIHHTLRPHRTVGLEGSERFVGLAAAAALPGVEFLCHDVRVTPFPVERADLVFARRLFAGPWLHEMPDPAGTERLIDEVAKVTPQASVSARICAMNVAVLTERGEIQPRPELEAALNAIADGSKAGAVPVVWSLRQIVLRRRA